MDESRGGEVHGRQRGTLGSAVVQPRDGLRASDGVLSVQLGWNVRWTSPRRPGRLYGESEVTGFAHSELGLLTRRHAKDRTMVVSIRRH